MCERLIENNAAMGEKHALESKGIGGKKKYGHFILEGGTERTAKKHQHQHQQKAC